MQFFGIDAAFLVYVLAFAAAALVCLASIPRARRIDDGDTRRGLMGLLVASGGWAACHVAFLTAPTVELKTAMYTLGLVVGLSAVGPWLYFCSAYTGRNIHRDPTWRRVAVATFLGIALVKATNPIHGAYFTTEFLASPFPHLAVLPGAPHWMAAGFAYALTAIGGFTLFELFRETGADARPLAGLVLLTGLPVFLDVVGYATPYLVDVTYEPLGVAAFAVGTLFVYTERFETVRMAGDVEDPVVLLDSEDRIREYNDRAAAVFPELSGAVGEPLSEAVPALAAHVGGTGVERATDGAGTVAATAEASVAGAEPTTPEEAGRGVLSVERGDGPRYFVVSTNPFSLGGTAAGRMLILTDVTRSERHRRELRRQNERLDRFASAVSHDLRNPLNAASAQLDLAQRECDSHHLDNVADEHDRMGALIEDVLALAREGRSIGETEPVDVERLVRNCWETVDTGGATLRMVDSLRIEADADRLQRVFENLFRNAIEHAGDEANPPTVRVGRLPGNDGFYVEDDGPGIPPDQRERVFETGHTTAREGTGYGLPIVREIAEAHGWSVSATEGADGGARFEIQGARLADSD